MSERIVNECSAKKCGSVSDKPICIGSSEIRVIVTSKETRNKPLLRPQIHQFICRFGAKVYPDSFKGGWVIGLEIKNSWSYPNLLHFHKLRSRVVIPSLLFCDSEC